MLRWLILAAVLAVVAAVVLVSGVLDSATPPARPVGNAAFNSDARPSRPAVLWAVGDATGSREGRAVEQRMAAESPERVLYLGDVYETGTPEELVDNFDSFYGPIARRTAPTPGNHEWPQHLQGYDPYWAKVTGHPTPPWYAFRAGGWTLLSLNSEAAHDAGSEQLRWLRAELHRRRGTCVLAYWHRPRFSAGLHGDAADMAPVWEALKGRATLVLSGHDHDMQRLRPRDGLYQYVAGTGGKHRYSVDRSDRRLAFADDAHFGALRVRLAPGHAALRFVAADGGVLDRSAVSCKKT